MSEKVKKFTLARLNSIPATAEILGGLSHWTIRKWIQQKKIRPTKVGRRVMISDSAIHDFLQDCARD